MYTYLVGPGIPLPAVHQGHMSQGLDPEPQGVGFCGDRGEPQTLDHVLHWWVGKVPGPVIL